VLRTLGDLGGSFLALDSPPSAVVVSAFSAFQNPISYFFLKSDNMEQIEAAFCRASMSIPSANQEPAWRASALNGSIKSLERVLRSNRQISNALRGRNLARPSTRTTLTKPKKPSSAKGFCHLVRDGAQTKWIAPPSARREIQHRASSIEFHPCILTPLLPPR
jgi:hypothetical protein